MARYIDTEEFMDLMYVMCAGQDKAFIKAVKRVVEDTPDADVVPVVHAHWTADGTCSKCGWDMATDSLSNYLAEDENHYCYNCGAKMDEVTGNG